MHRPRMGIRQQGTEGLVLMQEADAKVTWVSEELQRSERPELSAARVVVSGTAGPCLFSSRAWLAFCLRCFLGP